MKRIFCLLCVFSLLGACQLLGPPKDDNTRYVEEAFDILRQNIIVEGAVQLDALEADLLSQISDSTSMDTVHHLLRTAVQTINQHSDLLPPSEFKERVESPEQLEARGRIIYDSIAYVYVPGCEAVDSVHSKLYVDSLQVTLKGLYRANPVGWIVDLRDNTGGNMYAMLAGLGPFFSKGNLGYDIGKTEQPWHFKMENDEGEMAFIELANSAYEFDKKLPIAVLINGQTASAAEGMAISLKCYPRSILLGQKTYGVSTGNDMFFLSDSACLNVTTSIMADCAKNQYPNGVDPDIIIEDALELFEYAVRWIAKSRQ
ncbi:MAG: S41 family peptidase [Bacteroidota bacterium]